jgi:hypothetical protein
MKCFRTFGSTVEKFVFNNPRLDKLLSQIQHRGVWPMPSKEWIAYSSEVANVMSKELSLQNTPPMFPGMRLGPLTIRKEPKQSADFLWPGIGSDIVVSQKTMMLFQKNNIKGCGFSPVRSFSKSKWFELIIETNMFTPRKFKIRNACKKCGYYEIHYPSRGFPVDSNHWTGTDIFHYKHLMSYAIISDRLAKLLSNSSLKNFRVVPTNEWEWPTKS